MHSAALLRPPGTLCQEQLLTQTTKSLCTLSQKFCRRKVRLSQKSATVAEFCRCLAVFGDSRNFLRQCRQGLSLG